MLLFFWPARSFRRRLPSVGKYQYNVIDIIDWLRSNLRHSLLELFFFVRSRAVETNDEEIC